MKEFMIFIIFLLVVMTIFNIASKNPICLLSSDPVMCVQVNELKNK